MTNVAKLWQGHSVIVCLGNGGVGKTSVAATVGMAACEAGLRTLVMTVDPAKRLAQALGVRPSNYEAHEVKINARSLFVMMPDAKQTFDDLVRRLAKDPNKLLNNEIYRYFSNVLPGAHEFAAMERLQQSLGKYDLIVVDTPPSQNAMDFLNAPDKILDFLHGNVLNWLRRSLSKSPLMELGSGMAIRVLGMLAGRDLVLRIVEFLQAFESMYEGFRERASTVQQLWRSKQTHFVWVTSPEPWQVEATKNFLAEFQQGGLAVQSAIINRVHTAPYELSQEQALMGEIEKWPHREIVEQVWREEVAFADRDQKTVGLLRPMFETLWTLPELDNEVSDLASLRRLYEEWKS
jgi:anion-transporting  ArsA/GET3 family ATPase